MEKHIIISNNELGFIIPENSYEIKFDRAENFHNEHYFELPAQKYSQLNYQSLMRLGDALNIIISNHYNKFTPQVYLSVAVNSSQYHYLTTTTLILLAPFC